MYLTSKVDTTFLTTVTIGAIFSITFVQLLFSTFSSRYLDNIYVNL